MFAFAFLLLSTQDAGRASHYRQVSADSCQSSQVQKATPASRCVLWLSGALPPSEAFSQAKHADILPKIEPATLPPK